MSDLTRRLRERVCYASTNREWPNVELQEAANRIDALEECLLELMDACDRESNWRKWPEDKLGAWNKARALLDAHD